MGFWEEESKEAQQLVEKKSETKGTNGNGMMMAAKMCAPADGHGTNAAEERNQSSSKKR